MMNNNKISQLRKKRLLLLANHVGANHKAFYREYCQLISAGLVYWMLGAAFITAAGSAELKRLLTL
jgi:hypothetical protein